MESPFTKDGRIDPTWLKHISNRDALAAEIGAYFLAGEKLKPEVMCMAKECVMGERSSSVAVKQAEKMEYNPMMLCYFCNRTFHTGCVDLDADLIRGESVPWQCDDCKRDLSNRHCQDYFRVHQYKTKMIKRRAEFLKQTFLPEKIESFGPEIDFSSHDIQSFERRAVAIMAEDDPDSIKDSQSITPLVLKQAMKARMTKRASREATERLTAELDKHRKEIEELKREVMECRKTYADVRSTDTSMWSENMRHSPSFAGAQHSSMLSGTEQASVSNTLVQFYTAKDTKPEAENSVFSYRPDETRSNQAPIASNAREQSTSSGSTNDLSISQNDLTALITRLATAQERSEDRQLLEIRRKAIPKIAEFNGDESKWLIFKQDVERYRINCKFDDETIKLYLRGALKDEAYNIVRDIFDIESLDTIMSMLKAAFGDEMKMVRNRSEELKNFKFESTLYKGDAVKLQSAMQAYFSACNYAKVGYINTNTIAEAIFSQLNSEDRQRCKEFYIRKHPTCSVIVMDVQSIYDYLMWRMPLLDEAPTKKQTVASDEKSKTFQVQAVSASDSSSNETFKFEIRDKSKAPYIGYDMDKLDAVKRECVFCNSTEHYAVQCPSFMNLEEKDRFSAILERKLCKNCLVSTAHRAVECDIKASCGFKVDQNSRCTRKHHIAIHHVDAGIRSNRPKYGIGKRRPNTQVNAAQAQARINEAKAIASALPAPKTNETVAFHSTDPKTCRNKYEVLSVGNTCLDIPKSVKVFRVKLWGPKGHVIALVVGDSGSEVTLVREDLRLALGIDGIRHTLNMQWAESTAKTVNTIRCDFQIQGMDNNATKYSLRNCLASSELDLAGRSLNMSELKKQFPYLAKVPFAGYENEVPVMLIGSIHAHLMEGIQVISGEGEGPVAINTKIGWTVYGGMRHFNDGFSSEQAGNNQQLAVGGDELSESTIVDNESSISNDTLHKLLEGHFSIEALAIRPPRLRYTEDEHKALKLIQEEMKLGSDGYVEVPLIWNRQDNIIPKLPNNYPLVLKRQLAHENKLQKNPTHLKAFNDNVKELIDLGFLREATEDDMQKSWHNIWYLPMTLVVNMNKNPPKFRNVYDASCRYQETSLNENLLKGPDLLINILQPLFRMRMNRIAFTADVKSMFNMMRICNRDQQCQRVLWRESTNLPMKTYISTVMLFGPTCSPFTSQYVKNKTAEQWISSYPDAVRTLVESTYMDDVLTSEPSVSKALEVAKQCIEICSSINWQLVAFQSNSLQFLKSLPAVAVKREYTPILERESEANVTKVLGCFWNTIDDCFEFKLDNNIFIQLVDNFDLKPTKRDQASTLARIYDVMGLISHVTIRGKILLQRSWEQKLDWDEIIDEAAAKQWKKWLKQLKAVAKLKFPRQLGQGAALKDAKEIQLHMFCDAGTEAYGAVAYLAVNSGQMVSTSLIMSRARVTPLNRKTKMRMTEMPRLELTAALLAARMGNNIQSLLQGITVQKFFWCDSEVVLRWITNPNQTLLKYTIGSIEEILESTERKDWRYVPTELNVADFCTKMKQFDIVEDAAVWMNGPYFLRESEEHWPKMPDKLTKADTCQANNIYLEKLNYSTHKLPSNDCPIADDSAIDRLSPSIMASWTKLTRAVARALKLWMDVFLPLVKNRKINNTKTKIELRRLINLETLTPSDIERAEHFIFRKIQKIEFPIEYIALKSGKSVKNPMMEELNVFMDPEGIIRINSRVNRNSTAFPQQFCPLLPRKNVYVTLLLAYYHCKFAHVAVESQVAEIRSKVWIPQLRTALKSIKAKCNWCRLKNALPYSPIMAPLPDDRINPELKPFEVVGLDVLGPLKPTVNGNIKKIYILIFTCALTRYVHLHILESLESLRVLEAIVVFWTAYGPVRKFISDNGTNFKRAARMLKEDFEKAKIFAKEQSPLTLKLAELYRVEWQFNAVHAPWFGGMYERLIKEVKRALSTTLEKRKVNRVELNIAVQEAAHRINSRPLTVNSVDAADGEILTPHHLAKNKSPWPLLPGIHKNKYNTAPDKSIYRRGRVVADEILRKFTAGYLPVLTKRTKWHKMETPPKAGDLVLVIEPNKTRREWMRAKIVKVHLGRDGIARVADVAMPSGQIKRNRALRNLARLNLTTTLEEANQKVDVVTVTIISEFKYEIAHFFKSCANFTQSLFINTGTRAKNKVVMNSYINNCSHEFKLLLIERVAAELPLSVLVQEVAPVLPSISSIFRVCDYKHNIKTDQIYLSVIEQADYDKAMDNRRRIDTRYRFQLSFPSLIQGTAYFPTNFETIDDNRIDKVAKPLCLFNLPTIKRPTAEFVRQILNTFERFGTVTGFRWCIDDRKKKTRNFGFIFFDSKQVVLRLTNQTFSVGDEFISTRLCESTAIIVHPSKAYLLNAQNKAILSPKIMDANWLHLDLAVQEENVEVVPQKQQQNRPESPRPLIAPDEPVERAPCSSEAASIQTVPATTGSTIMEVDNADNLEEDMLEITVGTADVTFDRETTPCCVENVIQMPAATREEANLRVELSEKTSTAQPKLKEKSSSRFVYMKFNGSYPFEIFHRRVFKFITKYRIVAYRDHEDYGVAHIKFKDAKTAKLFKNVMENLRKREDECDIRFNKEEGPKIAFKAENRELKLHGRDRAWFVIHEDTTMHSLIKGHEWASFSFPSSQNVAK